MLCILQLSQSIIYLCWSILHLCQSILYFCLISIFLMDIGNNKNMHSILHVLIYLTLVSVVYLILVSSIVYSCLISIFLMDIGKNIFIHFAFRLCPNGFWSEFKMALIWPIRDNLFWKKEFSLSFSVGTLRESKSDENKQQNRIKYFPCLLPLRTSVIVNNFFLSNGYGKLWNMHSIFHLCWCILHLCFCILHLFRPILYLCHIFVYF